LILGKILQKIMILWSLKHEVFNQFLVKKRLKNPDILAIKILILAQILQKIMILSQILQKIIILWS